MTENKQEYPGFDSKTAHNKPDQFREVPLRAETPDLPSRRTFLRRLGIAIAAAATPALIKNLPSSSVEARPLTQEPIYWSILPDTPTTRTTEGICVLGNNILHAGGSGIEGISGRLDIFNTLTGVWQEKAGMITPRQAIGISAVGNKAYALGGRIYEEGSLMPQKTNECYNLDTNTWETKAPMLEAKSIPMVVTLPTGKILALGGDSNIGSTSTVQEYDPTLNTWQYRAPMPIALTSFAVTVPQNGIVCVFGGADGVGVSKRSFFYNPQSNSWSQGPDMPLSLISMRATSLNGKIYITGGLEQFPPELRKVLIYDPSTGTYSEGTDMINARSGHGSVTVNGKLYQIGGAASGVTTRNVEVGNFTPPSPSATPTSIPTASPTPTKTPEAASPTPTTPKNPSTPQPNSNNNLAIPNVPVNRTTN